ncbi:Pramel4 [Phodopus roborovskii]|uniref:Pramel4 protein n=1 Tax=Phodopus roborovskii TaxID=109678 RepID=A0AAU9YZN4_PHORO|nr:Pramel4 [Phodopus roborovskii]
MSSPLTLQMLARSSLLKNEALAISALNKLPMELFPPVFKDAFKGKQTKILSAMRCLIFGMPIITSGTCGLEQRMVSALQMSSERPNQWCTIPKDREKRL